MRPSWTGFILKIRIANSCSATRCQTVLSPSVRFHSKTLVSWEEHTSSQPAYQNLVQTWTIQNIIPQPIFILVGSLHWFSWQMMIWIHVIYWLNNTSNTPSTRVHYHSNSYTALLGSIPNSYLDANLYQNLHFGIWRSQRPHLGFKLMICCISPFPAALIYWSSESLWNTSYYKHQDSCCF